MKNLKPLRRPLFHVTLAMITAHAIATGNAWASDGNASQPFTWKDGPQVYASVCAYCHEFEVGPQLRNRSLPPEYIRGVVRHGLGGMPPFRISEIDDESLAKLADFISKSKARP
jgi:mono/diheme cytochrome c family protein